MVLEKQYALVRQSRLAAFAFIETSLGSNINTPLTAFGNKNISGLCVHAANCYLDWLLHFALKQPTERLKQAEYTSMAAIRSLFERVDQIMVTFWGRFEENPYEAITGTSDGWPPVVSATPVEVFTHVVAHEFHHKGQIMLMCSQLGHTPPDTDIYALFKKVEVNGA